MNKDNEDLKTLKAYELTILLKELKKQKMKQLNDEAIDTFGKLFIDLNIDEIKESGINIRREYNRFQRRLFLDISRYANCGVIYTDGSLRSFYEKYKEFKENYYKKHPNEKK